MEDRASPAGGSASGEGTGATDVRTEGATDGEEVTGGAEVVDAAGRTLEAELGAEGARGGGVVAARGAAGGTWMRGTRGAVSFTEEDDALDAPGALDAGGTVDEVFAGGDTDGARVAADGTDGVFVIGGGGSDGVFFAIDGGGTDGAFFVIDGGGTDGAFFVIDGGGTDGAFFVIDGGGVAGVTTGAGFSATGATGFSATGATGFSPIRAPAGRGARRARTEPVVVAGAGAGAGSAGAAAATGSDGSASRASIGVMAAVGGEGPSGELDGRSWAGGGTDFGATSARFVRRPERAAGWGAGGGAGGAITGCTEAGGAIGACGAGLGSGAIGEYLRSVTGSGAAEVKTSSSSCIDGMRARTTTTSSLPDFGAGTLGFVCAAIWSSAHGSRMGSRGTRGEGRRDARRWLDGVNAAPVDEGSGERAGGGEEPGGDEGGAGRELPDGGGGGALDGLGGFGNVAAERAARGAPALAAPGARMAKPSPVGVGGGGGTARAGRPKLGGGGGTALCGMRAIGGAGVAGSGDAPNGTVIPLGGRSASERRFAETSVISSPSGVRGAASGGMNPGGGIDSGRATIGAGCTEPPVDDMPGGDALGDAAPGDADERGVEPEDAADGAEAAT